MTEELKPAMTAEEEAIMRSHIDNLDEDAFFDLWGKMQDAREDAQQVARRADAVCALFREAVVERIKRDKASQDDTTSAEVRRDAWRL